MAAAASRTVTVTPAGEPERHGHHHGDGDRRWRLTATDTFVVNVNAVNDVPSFTKGANQTVAANAGAQTVNRVGNGAQPGPANESAQALNFIVSNNNTRCSRCSRQWRPTAR